MSAARHIAVTCVALGLLVVAPTASGQLVGVCPGDLCPEGTSCSECGYDERGRLEAVTLEMGDGADERRTYRYDAEGLLREALHDSDQDGAANVVCHFEPGCPPPYSQCEPECFSQYLWADGVGLACPLEAECYYARCACDDEGRVLIDVDESTARGRRREVERREHDYDALGRRVATRVYIGGDARVAWSERYVYDDAGDRVREEVDRDGDGQADQVRSFVYDAAGRVLTETLDHGDDGWIDQRWTYRYDGDSEGLGGTFVVELDRGDDGTVDVRETYRWNAAGLPTLWEQDSDLDGLADVRAAYAYDTRGREVRHEYQERQHSAWRHSVTSYEYDDLGRRTMATVDVDADGAVEQICQYAPPCPPPYRGEICRRACAPAPD